MCLGSGQCPKYFVDSGILRKSILELDFTIRRIRLNRFSGGGAPFVLLVVVWTSSYLAFFFRSYTGTSLHYYSQWRWRLTELDLRIYPE
jgi:hypothetical protein